MQKQNSIHHRLINAAALLVLASLSPALQASTDWTVIDFDTAANWTAGSGVVTSYQTDHQFNEAGWTFSGGPAMRQTTTETNGSPGAFGSYGWRLRDAPGTAWGGTFSDGPINQIRFDLRAWNETTDIEWIIRTSTDGGESFSNALLINRSLLTSTEWSTVAVSLSATAYIDQPDTWILFEVSRLSGERLMIDNFAFTAVPEPKTTAAIIGAFTLFIVLRARQQRGSRKSYDYNPRLGL